MNLAQITPLILTYNEEQNIARCLGRLRWARQVLVIDSGSTDTTLQICGEFPNVCVLHRPFDSFAGQCNFGLESIRTEWVLSMDADYVVPEVFAKTLEGLDESRRVGGYRFPFRYCIHGRPLRASLYPPRTVLYRISEAKYGNEGHGHRVKVEGRVEEVPLKIDHDDRKPLGRWLDAQRKYAALEAAHLSKTTAGLSRPDTLRKMVWPAPLAAMAYTLFVNRLILDGWPGWYYVAQRTYAELLLSLELMERRLITEGGRGNDVEAARKLKVPNTPL
jgi:glycosyltransferase involved in cell wall biosynthesis